MFLKNASNKGNIFISSETIEVDLNSKKRNGETSADSESGGDGEGLII